MKELTLELTNKCNLKCLHCSSEADIECDKFLAFDECKNAINIYNPEYIKLSGGEPLLHPQFLKVIEYSIAQGVKVNLYTSSIVDDFELKLKSIAMIGKLNSIVFPVYCMNAKIHDTITKKESHEQIIKNIKLALSLQFNVEIHIVPMSLNYKYLHDTIDALVKLNINKINLLKLVVQGRAINSLVPNELELREILNKIENDYGNKIKLGLPFNHGKCTAGIDKLVLKYDGNVIPCEAYKDGVCKCERLKI